MFCLNALCSRKALRKAVIQITTSLEKGYDEVNLHISKCKIPDTSFRNVF